MCVEGVPVVGEGAVTALVERRAAPFLWVHILDVLLEVVGHVVLDGDGGLHVVAVALETGDELLRVLAVEEGVLSGGLLSEWVRMVSR